MIHNFTGLSFSTPIKDIKIFEYDMILQSKRYINLYSNMLFFEEYTVPKRVIFRVNVPSNEY